MLVWGADGVFRGVGRERIRVHQKRRATRHWSRATRRSPSMRAPSVDAVWTLPSSLPGAGAITLSCARASTATSACLCLGPVGSISNTVLGNDVISQRLQQRQPQHFLGQAKGVLLGMSPSPFFEQERYRVGEQIGRRQRFVLRCRRIVGMVIEQIIRVALNHYGFNGGPSSMPTRRSTSTIGCCRC